jgi:predicted nucleic acid-binding protein
MSDTILDCCSLINLHCGWGGIQELARVHKPRVSDKANQRFCIGEIALAEAKYAREFHTDGTMVAIDVSKVELLSQYPLVVLQVAGAAEQFNFVELAKQIDDGEAEALTLAAERELILVTDDRLAVNVAARSNSSFKVIGTADILIEWGNSDPNLKARLPNVVRRISELARFCPHRSD